MNKQIKSLIILGAVFVFIAGYIFYDFSLKDQKALVIDSSLSAQKKGGGNQTYYPISINYDPTGISPQYVNNYIPPQTIGFANYKLTSTFSKSVSIVGMEFVDMNSTYNTTAQITYNNITNPFIPTPNGPPTAHFYGINIPILANGTISIPLSLIYSHVGIAGVASGVASWIKLNKLTFVDNAGFNFSLCDQGCTYSFIPSNILESDKMVMVGSKPFVNPQILPSNLLVNGLQRVFRFSVTATNNGDIKILSFPLNISSIGTAIVSGAPNSVVVKNVANGNIINTTNPFFNIVPGGNANIKIDFSSAITVGPGVTKTFDVFVPVSGVTLGSMISTKFGSAVDFSWKDVVGGNLVPFTSQNATYLYPWNTSATTIIN